MATPQLFEKALADLFKKVQYLAGKGIINAKSLGEYKWIINTLKEAYINIETDRQETELSQSQLLEQNEKLKLMLRMGGLSNNAIENFSKLPTKFLQAQTDRIVQNTDYKATDIQWTELQVNYNSFVRSSICDRQTIDEYAEMSKSDIAIKTEMLAILRNSFPHLTQFFNHIDANPDKPILDLDAKIRSHYVG